MPTPSNSSNSNSTTNVSQINVQSNQNYDVDILTLFKHYVTGGNTPNDNEPGENIGIDDIRAQISASVTGASTKTADLITSLNINPTTTTPAATPNNTTPVLLAQESRCHTFYRILGLPVVNSDQSDFYNPGFDIVTRSNITRTIDLSKKITIAQNVGSNFEAISSARESWPTNTSKIFSNPSSVEAGVLALTSGISGAGGATNKRSFNILQNVKGPFDYNSSDQSYTITQTYCTVGNKYILLSDFQDANGNSINSYSNNTPKTPSGIFFQHQHIIVPFLVDPRIDFSINSSESITFQGTSRRIAVPFVPDATFLQVDSTSTAQRPIIESIIKQRVYQSSQIPQAGDAIIAAQTLIKSDPNIGTIKFIGNNTISNIFSGSVFNLSQQSSFADTLSIIQSMIDKLIAAIQTIQGTMGIYYWLPYPNTNGPEGGCQIRDVPLNSNFNSLLITDEDYNIIISQVQSLFSQPLASTSSANAVPDIAKSAFTVPIMSFNKNTTNAQGDVSSVTMNNALAKRKKKINEAIDALQIIEMIMGEFSGFGLCDIIAIIGTLYTMPLENLVGFLDTDSYTRAQTTLGQNFSPATSTAPTGQSNIIASMNALLTGVTSFYQVMDQIFVDKLGNGGLLTT